MTYSYVNSVSLTWLLRYSHRWGRKGPRKSQEAQECLQQSFLVDATAPHLGLPKGQNYICPVCRGGERVKNLLRSVLS